MTEESDKMADSIRRVQLHEWKTLEEWIASLDDLCDADDEEIEDIVRKTLEEKEAGE